MPFSSRLPYVVSISHRFNETFHPLGCWRKLSLRLFAPTLRSLRFDFWLYRKERQERAKKTQRNAGLAYGFHGFAVLHLSGSKRPLSRSTLARISEYASVVVVLPSIIKMTSGAIQPPPSRSYLLNCVSDVSTPSLPVGRNMRTKYSRCLSIQNWGECMSPALAPTM